LLNGPSILTWSQHIPVRLSIVAFGDGLGNFLAAVRPQYLFSLYGYLFTLLQRALLCDGLSLNTLGSSFVQRRALVGFSILCVGAEVFNVNPVPVKLPSNLGGSSQKEGPEESVVFLLQERPVVEEIIEDAVAGNGNQLSKLVVIVVPAPGCIR